MVAERNPQRKEKKGKGEREREAEIEILGGFLSSLPHSAITGHHSSMHCFVIHSLLSASLPQPHRHSRM